MDIQDALEPTGEARKGSNLADYAHLVKDEDSDRHSLMWVIDGKNDGNVQYEDIFEDDWQPYHEVKEIRPEKEGELWKNNVHINWFIRWVGSSRNKGLQAVSEQGVCFDVKGLDMIHGKEWTRLFPPVEDESVERIEIERVAWRQSHGVYFPTADTDIEFSELKEKGRMKMILVIPKDKP